MSNILFVAQLTEGQREALMAAVPGFVMKCRMEAGMMDRTESTRIAFRKAADEAEAGLAVLNSASCETKWYG